MADDKKEEAREMKGYLKKGARAGSPSKKEAKREETRMSKRGGE